MDDKREDIYQSMEGGRGRKKEEEERNGGVTHAGEDRLRKSKGKRP